MPQVGTYAARLVAETDWELFQRALDRARQSGEAWFLFRQNGADLQWLGHLESLGCKKAASSREQHLLIWRWQVIEPACQSLSPRQREVLLAFSDGRSPDQIARACGISPNTVRTHLLRCQHAVQCHDYFDLYRWAREHRRVLSLLAGDR